ncbi:MAG: adenosylmethionine--8-amino-7-oxononanoate transaminase [Gammaproteobacteria bacterium]
MIRPPEELIHSDLKHIWHPGSQMKDYETFQPLVVAAASGSYIDLADGKKLIDAISSWWSKSLGHNHPRLKHALMQQLERFEHVMLANTTNATIVKLAEKLAQLSPSLTKVFFAGDGSCVVEIALKMSLHARKIQGETKRTQFIALKNGYHGETVGALSVSDIGLYRAPYKTMLFDTYFISPLPYLTDTRDPLWSNCLEYWRKIEKKLESLAETTTAIIVEPIVQGAAGMKIYSQHFLKLLRSWTKKHKIHLIADEIMTGIGRTGKMLACEHAHIEPDFLCLSKGLSGGWLPFSAVLTRNDIYQLFYDDYKSNKGFVHSHTYSGNTLGASVALEVLIIFEQEKILHHVAQLGETMLTAMKEIAATTNKLKNVRGIGAIVAADLVDNPSEQRLGFAVYQNAVKLGALLRPIGNTIYWLPPLNTTFQTIEELKNITREAILSVY